MADSVSRLSYVSKIVETCETLCSLPLKDTDCMGLTITNFPTDCGESNKDHLAERGDNEEKVQVDPAKCEGKQNLNGEKIEQEELVGEG